MNDIYNNLRDTKIIFCLNFVSVKNVLTYVEFLKLFKNYAVVINITENNQTNTICEIFKINSIINYAITYYDDFSIIYNLPQKIKLNCDYVAIISQINGHTLNFFKNYFIQSIISLKHSNVGILTCELIKKYNKIFYANNDNFICKYDIFSNVTKLQEKFQNITPNILLGYSCYESNMVISNTYKYGSFNNKLPSNFNVAHYKFLNNLNTTNNDAILNFLKNKNDLYLVEKIPFEFEPNNYKLINHDLMHLNDNELINQYLTEGIYENRKYIIELPEDFNPKVYKLLNKKLENFDENNLEYHYLCEGIYENLCYKSDDLLDLTECDISLDIKNSVIFINGDSFITHTSLFLYNFVLYLKNNNPPAHHLSIQVLLGKTVYPLALNLPK